MKKIYIAPIAGVTDYTFRGILEEFKPDLIFTEMVSVNALSVLNDKTISKILRLREGNAVQIFGEDIEKIKSSAKYIENLGVKHINLNCGCPMKKIVNCGYGAALVKEPEKIKTILSELRSCLKDDTKISIKIRIGYKEPENYIKIGKIAEEISCDHITVHGRTREQLYSGKADWQHIKEVKDNISIPVIGNGDIFTGEDALEKISYSNVDGVMLARGIFGNPWLIEDIREILEYGEIKTPTTKEDKIKMAIEHLKRIRLDNDEKFVFDVRKHISWYLKGLENSTEAKRKINQIDDYDEIIRLLEGLY
jgi:dihydrouridine--tRNA ligase